LPTPSKKAANPLASVLLAVLASIVKANGFTFRNNVKAAVSDRRGCARPLPGFLERRRDNVAAETRHHGSSHSG